MEGRFQCWWTLENFKARVLGLMMKIATKVEWEKTDNPMIFQTWDSTMIKILCGVTMIAKPQEVTITVKQTLQCGNQAEHEKGGLVEKMLKHVLDELWSKSDADVGLVKSANPVKMELKPNVKLSKCPQ